MTMRFDQFTTVFPEGYDDWTLIRRGDIPLPEEDDTENFENTIKPLRKAKIITNFEDFMAYINSESFSE
jgi:hypothetical protein